MLPTPNCSNIPEIIKNKSNWIRNRRGGTNSQIQLNLVVTRSNLWSNWFPFTYTFLYPALQKWQCAGPGQKREEFVVLGRSCGFQGGAVVLYGDRQRPKQAIHPSVFISVAEICRVRSAGERRATTSSTATARVDNRRGRAALICAPTPRRTGHTRQPQSTHQHLTFF